MKDNKNISPERLQYYRVNESVNRALEITDRRNDEELLDLISEKEYESDGEFTRKDKTTATSKLGYITKFIEMINQTAKSIGSMLIPTKEGLLLAVGSLSLGGMCIGVKQVQE
jgi:hypothetical protein